MSTHRSLISVLRQGRESTEHASPFHSAGAGLATAEEPIRTVVVHFAQCGRTGRPRTGATTVWMAPYNARLCRAADPADPASFPKCTNSFAEIRAATFTIGSEGLGHSAAVRLIHTDGSPQGLRHVKTKILHFAAITVQSHD